MTLSPNDKDTIRDLVSSEAWQSVVQLCAVIVYNHEQAVLKCDVSTEAQQRMMFLNKARLDGAKAVLAAMENAKALVKER